MSGAEVDEHYYVMDLINRPELGGWRCGADIHVNKLDYTKDCIVR
jgi:hypothetical protein